MQPCSQMKEFAGNIWGAHFDGVWVCIPTNGTRNSSGHAVMDDGVARQATERFPALPELLGKYLVRYGNRVFVFRQQQIITLPTRHDYGDTANMELIKNSCRQLAEVVKKYALSRVVMPRLSCNNGDLTWEDIKREISPLLDDCIDVLHQEEATPEISSTGQDKIVQYNTDTSECLCQGFYQPLHCPVHGIDSRKKEYHFECLCGWLVSTVIDPRTPAGACPACGGYQYTVYNKEGVRVI